MVMLDNDDDPLRPAHSGGAVADPATEPATPVFPDEEGSASRSRDETIFSVLAGRARSRPLSHLWITAVIGAVDAAALAIARPGWWWIAAVCASVSGYATWGIADRALERLGPERRHGTKGMALRLVEGLAIACGILGAAAAVIGFLGVSVGKTGPPG